MHIGYVIWSLGLGGAEQVVIRLARGFASRACRVTVFTLNEPGRFADVLKERGIPIVSLNKKGPLDIGITQRLAGAFRSRGVDVVHTHLWGANVWGRLAAAKAGIPVVVTEHNVDTWKKPHHFLIDQRLEPKADALIAVSREVQTFYENHGVGRGRWEVVYNGVESADVVRERGEAFRALGITASDRVVGLVGRLVPAKAPLVFLQAIERLSQRVPNVKALIIGDGPLRQEVEAFIRERNLGDKVVLAGLRQDVPVLLAGMDVLAFSSEREGLSMAMLEAMAAGVPLVATRVGGTPELIEDGKTGLLVEPAQPAALADALARVLTDAGAAASLRDAARARVAERFSLRAMIDAHERIYRSLDASVGSPYAGQAAANARRICLVIDHLGMGGAQRQLVELAKRLPALGWQPVVVALSTRKTIFVDELRQAGVPVHLIPQNGALDFGCLERLTRLLRRIRPAVVHTWLFTADTYGRVASRRAGVRRIVCAMRNTIDDMPPRQRLVNRALTGWTSAVTVNAEAIRKGLVEQGGIPSSKIHTIYNGIYLNGLAEESSPHEPAALDWPVRAGVPVVGMIARLSAQKDHRTFLEAARLVSQQKPETAFVLIGDGPMRSAIEGWIQELGLAGKVHLLGERKEARAFLPRFTICALASRYEGCSNVVMEAMAAARPVVASDVGGNRELIVDGKTGLIVPPRDASSLAQAILSLLQDPARATAMGRAGRERVQREFTLDATAERTGQLYEELMKDPT